MSQFTGRKHIVCDAFELNVECHRVIHQGSIFFLCVGQFARKARGHAVENEATAQQTLNRFALCANTVYKEGEEERQFIKGISVIF